MAGWTKSFRGSGKAEGPADGGALALGAGGVSAVRPQALIRPIASSFRITCWAQ